MSILMLTGPVLTRVRCSIYVGTVLTEFGWHRSIFRSATKPTKETHPQFDYSLGPFRTIRGAKAAIHFGWNGNPHMLHVNHYEKLGKDYADRLRSLPLEKSY